MPKIILFKADRGESKKYREISQTQLGESFYSVANADSVPVLTKTIAEHYDASEKSIPEPGYQLTETVPENPDLFRDNGWEVVRVESYFANSPNGQKLKEIAICYCAYKPLPLEASWTKKLIDCQFMLNFLAAIRQHPNKLKPNSKP